MRPALSVRIALSLTIFCIVPSYSAIAQADNSIEFNRDVRPILSAHCFKCHGPDDQTREAGIRFDIRESALAEADSGAYPIVPGEPDTSELIARIFAEDADVQMPPPSANKPLTDQQKETLKAWIAAGAEYAPHWSFVPPQQAPLPAVQRADWPRNPVDHFLLAKIEAAGLQPSPQANRTTLVRRLYLDLIGLPPTPAEVDAYVNDISEDAYESLVDRLLSSPHYGERWARRWLDLARYADTNGYEKDRVRSIWPYRDWVIHALNADMPFDQFSVEQLAGDLLPDATLDQRIATGLHRNTMLNEEGGIDPLEFRFHAMVDRVNTTGTIWLGLTLGCAQCHTHKYDPITQRDYYQTMAFLNNADEPVIDVPQPEIAQKRATIQAEIAAIEADLPNRFPTDGEYRWHNATIVEFRSSGGATAEMLPDSSVRLSGNSPDTDTYTLIVESSLPRVAAIQLEAIADPQLPSQGPGRTGHGNFVLSELAVTASSMANPTQSIGLTIASAEADFAQDGFPPEHAFDGNAKTGWAIHGTDSWNVTRAATFRFASAWSNGGATRFEVRLDQQFGGQHTLGRFRIRFGELIDNNQPEDLRRAEHLERKFNEWIAQASTQAARWTLLEPVAAASDVPTLTILDDHSILASGDQTKRDVYRLKYSNPQSTITALRLEALPDDSLPAGGPGRIAYEGPIGDFYLSELTARASDRPIRFAAASHSYAKDKNNAPAAIDGDPQTGWSINGAQGQAHTAVFRLAEPLTSANEIELELLFERYYAAGLGRFRIWATDDSRELTVQKLPTHIEQLLSKPTPERSPDENSELLSYFLSITPDLAGEREKIRQLRESMPAYPTTLVMVERPAEHPRRTFVHRRGEFLQPTDAVEPQLPAMFASTTSEQPHDRLSFARWLVSEENPLVARVTVNRHWAAFFGKGLVRTTEDFGYQGDPPTHPELLDWLAVEFQRQGWSLKQLHRLIVTSAAYRQSSHVTEQHLEVDPENKLLARAPRVRLDAELVRDATLRASGLLSSKLGGPSVFPPQPAGVTSEGAYGPLEWRVSEGEDRYRRGLYTFMKRTAPFAMSLTFDGPSGEACVARREVSNTPLQALTLLNDSVFVEAAQTLSRDLVRYEGTLQDRIDYLFRRCTARAPTEWERQQLAAYYQTQHDRLASQQPSAADIAGHNEGDVVALAAWSLTARAVLNLDEVIVKE